MNDALEKFLDAFKASFADNTFVRLTLGNYKGADEHLQKLMVRIVETKKGRRLFLQYKFTTRDVVKNYEFDEGSHAIVSALEQGFKNGHLFTTERDFQLDIGKRNSRLNIGKPTFKSKPSVGHDREKKRLIDQDSFYLKALGITTDDGQVKAQQHDKWKQINKFVEILAGLYDSSSLKGKKKLKIADMGSGKGYLTFAAYDLFANVRGLEVEMEGVDRRSETIDLCNNVSKANEFSGLKFVEGSIAEYDPGEVDILIALHACDTATDDAIFKGITAKAQIIVAAPCCHREIRKQINPPESLLGILKHSILRERTAESITDGLRALLLETAGYSTKMFEFVPTEHTPKNNMLVAVKSPNPAKQEAARAETYKLMSAFGIGHQRLVELLQNSDNLIRTTGG